jgi:hypothetical protein
MPIRSALKPKPLREYPPDTLDRFTRAMTACFDNSTDLTEALGYITRWLKKQADVPSQWDESGGYWYLTFEITLKFVVFGFESHITSVLPYYPGMQLKGVDLYTWKPKKASFNPSGWLDEDGR